MQPAEPVHQDGAGEGPPPLGGLSKQHFGDKQRWERCVLLLPQGAAWWEDLWDTGATGPAEGKH